MAPPLHDEGQARVPDGLGLLRVPGWERFPWLRAAFSTRQGGASTVYGAGEQNLAWTREDDPEIVRANRERFLAAVAGTNEPMPLVTQHQIHSGLIRYLETERAPFMAANGRARMRGDGLLSRQPGRFLGVITADCVPVLIADTRSHAVAAFHAGWRGTLARIVERGVGALRVRYGSQAADLVAAVGPAIGACCFAIGDEVRTGFAGTFPYGEELFTRDGAGQWSMDLHEANRRQLLDAGLATGNISMLPECTACSRLEDGDRRYFSHRAEHGRTGRMLSVVGALA